MLLSCTTALKGSLYGLLLTPPTGLHSTTGPTPGAVDLSHAFVDAIPAAWLHTFHTSSGWRRQDTIGAISLSIGVLPSGRLDATLRWFRTISSVSQQLCWPQRMDGVPEQYDDFFGFLNNMLLNPNSLNDRVPRRFMSLPPGYLSTSIPQIFNPVRYADTGFLSLLQGFLTDYEESSRMGAWWTRTNAVLDELGSRLGRMMFATFLTRYTCPGNACSSFATPGAPYYPPDAKSLLTFFVNRLQDGHPFVVTTSAQNMTLDMYWLHVEINWPADKILKKVEKRSLDHGHADDVEPNSLEAELARLSQPGPLHDQVLQEVHPDASRASNTTIYGSNATFHTLNTTSRTLSRKPRQLDGPLYGNLGVYHARPPNHARGLDEPSLILTFAPPMTAYISGMLYKVDEPVYYQTWTDDSISVNMHRILPHGRVILRGPGIIFWGNQSYDVGPYETASLVDTVTVPVRRLIQSTKFYKSRNVPIHIPHRVKPGDAAPPDEDEWAETDWRPASDGYSSPPGGGGDDDPPFGEGWARTNWRPAGAASAPVDSISPDGDTGPHGSGYISGGGREHHHHSSSTTTTPKTTTTTSTTKLPTPTGYDLDESEPAHLRPYDWVRTADPRANPAPWCRFRRTLRIVTRNVGGEPLVALPAGRNVYLPPRARNRFRCAAVFWTSRVNYCPIHRMQCASDGIWTHALSVMPTSPSSRREPGFPIQACSDLGEVPRDPPGRLVCTRLDGVHGQITVWCDDYSTDGQEALNCWGPDESSRSGWYNWTSHN